VKKLYDERKVIQLYSDGYSSNEIANIFNLNGQTILNCLHRNNIIVKDCNDPIYLGRNKINKFDTSFFFTESEKLAYMMGFILGDGNLRLNKKHSAYRITITAHVNDLSHIVMFCDWIKYDPKNIGFSKKVKRCDLMLNDKVFDTKSDYFKEWGIVPVKTYNPIIPIAPILNDKRMLRLFLIGLIDADGSVSFKYGGRYGIELVGNNVIMSWVKSMFDLIGYGGQLLIVGKDEDIWSRIVIQKKLDVLELAKALDIKNCDFCMDRKWSDIKKALADDAPEYMLRKCTVNDYNKNYI